MAQYKLTMAKIIIADIMEQEVVEEIKKLGEVIYKPVDLKAMLTDANVLIVRSATKVTKELIANAQNLRIVARAGVGLDNIDAVACEAKKIKVINTPSAPTNAVAELTIALIIVLFRNVAKAHFQMKNKIWDKKNLTGSEISGKTLGILGFGRIGAMVAEKAQALGMNVIAFDKFPRETPNIKFVDLNTLLSSSDVISIHLALTPETKNIINKEAIDKMKEGAYIVNTARGELIDEEALYEGCKSGRLAGAAVDVYATEPYRGKLLELNNVCFTSHIGAATKEAQMKIGKELVEKLKVELD